ncbi:MAG TPA: pilin [Verrucomicrobiae bacterium]|nr:pilin [Verrucomicrobiae bacterium]
MHGPLTVPLLFTATAWSASTVMSSFISPVVVTLCAVGSLASTFFLVNGGIAYITSTGKPEDIDRAKRIIRNALIGLILIFAAGTLTQILTHAYGVTSTIAHTTTPRLTAITPAPVSNGLVNVIVKAITGVLDYIVQTLASPFIGSLAYFTKSTPLMADNSTVFSMWLAVVGVTDALLVLVIVLLGFHVMSAATFGLNEAQLKHLLPRICLIFLALNTSIFMIDGVIELSNTMIRAVNFANSTTLLWNALTAVVRQSTEFGLPALLIMLLFTIFSVILVIYYLGRLITLYLGAVLSPLILLLWLVPGFRDFSETAAKAYIMTIFVLFVQVVILIVSGSLIASVAGGPTQAADPLMSILAGVAAMYAVLRVPSIMDRFSLASMGSRNIRQLGGEFINGVSFMVSRTRISDPDNNQPYSINTKLGVGSNNYHGGRRVTSTNLSSNHPGVGLRGTKASSEQRSNSHEIVTKSVANSDVKASRAME